MKFKLIDIQELSFDCLWKEAMGWVQKLNTCEHSSKVYWSQLWSSIMKLTTITFWAFLDPPSVIKEGLSFGLSRIINHPTCTFPKIILSFNSSYGVKPVCSLPALPGCSSWASLSWFLFPVWNFDNTAPVLCVVQCAVQWPGSGEEDQHDLHPSPNSNA